MIREKHMNQEELFSEQLAALRELAKEKNGPITVDDVKEAFDELELDDEQLKLIIRFLREQAKIKVDDPDGFANDAEGSGISFDGGKTEDKTGEIGNADGRNNSSSNEDEEEESALDGEDSRFLQMYLEEIEDLSELTDGKKRALFMNAMNGDKPAKDELIQGFLKTVCDIAKLYANQGVPMEDLIGEGNVALATAMNVIEHEESPETAEEMVAGMIMKAMEELVQDDALSRDAFENWAEKANEVLEKAQELSEMLLRKVTIEELCKEYEFDPDFVKDVIEVTGGKIEFLDLEKKE